MQFRPLLQHLCFVAMAVSIETVGAKLAYAIETLSEITVTAPRKPLADQINSPQMLDEEDISIAHERSIADVIQGFPGISSSKVGGFGQIGALNIRGAGGQGMVTLDGIPLLQSVPGFLNLDTLPTEAIQKAEIERGPSSAYHSFQALGGAIRLYTQDRQDTGGKLSVEGGSFGILRETLQSGVNGTLGRMTVTLSRADAFDGAPLANPANNPERDPSHFTQGIMRFSSDLTSRLLWQGSMLYRKSGASTDKFGIDEQGRVAFQDDPNSAASEETWLAQNSLSYKVASNWNTHLQLGFTQLANSVNAGPLQNGVTSRLFLANWSNTHTIIDNDKQKLQWHVTWGGQGRHEQGASPTIGFSQERTMASGYIDTQAQHGNLSAEAGVRVEHFDQFGDHTLFKTAAAWQITPNLTIRASGGTGYRLPSFTELLFLFFGNPQLKPERSASGNLGLEWYPVTGMKITLNGYYHRYHDLITPAYDPHRGAISLNVADASVAGMELESQYASTDSLDTGISYTYADNRDLNTDKNLPLRPQHTARVWGQQKLTHLPITLWAETVIRSATWNDVANTIPVNGSVQVNASIRYALSNNAEIYLRGENLLNNRTPQVYSIYMPGVAVYGGFRLDF
ncbi:vitamin B12 transporter BtuB [Methyloglobulus morosus KoM1]|uniref:Vitamin B12 transporter BtuB n=1 Tax=Methyloglobulus morosus KoM1 TaxID=1116472 RepID=V5BYU9_9GAMM|nr:TonB-dependent receptor [Methyloglobulus morosus]ESS71432.1 vitamin B12 transporter BtuB [Methyloglobulus morosus KoM1]